MTTIDSTVTHLREDAERNRVRLVEAASCAFAECGFEVSIEEIARRAGLGKGTVFRRFPTKEHLVAAIACERMESLLESSVDLLDADDPDEAMHEFMRRAVQLLTQDRGLLEAIHGLAITNDNVQSIKHEILQTVEALLARAQASGSIRPDITSCDVMLLVAAVSHVVNPFVGLDSDLWTRYLDIVFDGLRSGAARPCSHPPPTEEQMKSALSSSGSSFRARLARTSA